MELKRVGQNYRGPTVECHNWNYIWGVPDKY